MSRTLVDLATKLVFRAQKINQCILITVLVMLALTLHVNIHIGISQLTFIFRPLQTNYLFQFQLLFNEVLAPTKLNISLSLSQCFFPVFWVSGSWVFLHNHGRVAVASHALVSGRILKNHSLLARVLGAYFNQNWFYTYPPLVLIGL